MYNSYQKYINTIAELYISRVKYSTITSNIRNYKSSLEKAVIHDDASIKVYDTLVNTVNKMININHEFIDLKRKLLKLDSFNMYDIYCNPLELDFDKITFAQAKEEVLNALSILGKDYIKLLNEAFDNRWIDVYEKENKRARSI